MDDEVPSEKLKLDDFRAVRDYLPDDSFALVTGTYEGPTDLIPEEEWKSLINLPTDVLLRTTDRCGTQVAQMNRLHSDWIFTLPLEVDAAPYMFNAGWDAADDFNAAVFTGIHGYYRQALANLRSALDSLTIAASFAVRKNSTGLDKWIKGESEPPKFGNARDMVAPHLGTDATSVLNTLYKQLSGYVHSQNSGTNAVLWGGSNGPVWEFDSLVLVYRNFRDVMAMGFALLSVGWDGFSIPTELWPLFETPGGAWTDTAVISLRQ